MRPDESASEATYLPETAASWPCAIYYAWEPKAGFQPCANPQRSCAHVPGLRPDLKHAIVSSNSNNLMPSSQVEGSLDHVHSITQAARPAAQVLGMPAVGSMRGICEGRRTCCGTESLPSLAAALPVKMRAVYLMASEDSQCARLLPCALISLQAVVGALTPLPTFLDPRLARVTSRYLEQYTSI